MNRYLTRTASAVLVSCLVGLAGAAPVQAGKTKDGTGTQPTGTRFTGRSPSYTVYLQVAGQEKRDESGQPLKDADGYAWFDPCAFRLAVEQSPNVKAYSYAVAVNSPLLSSMDVHITMGDGQAPTPSDGTAECSKLPEELQRFVGEYKALRRAVDETRALLDVKEAGMDQTRKPARSLEELVFEDEQRIWELQHIAAPPAKLESARQRLTADQGRLKSARASASSQTKRLQDVDALRRELATLQERLASHRFTLNPGRAHISVGGQSLTGDPPSQPWVTVEVNEE
jgi:hypothetical protein